jgi:SAM-dependent methyltransferase
MTGSSTPPVTTYIHGAAPEEQERLAALNRMNNPLFMEFLDLGGARTILEVGCGMGLLTECVARAAPTATVVGIEQLPEQLARAPQGEAAPENLRFIQADAHHLPFGDGSFDIVYCRFVLEHLRDPAAALREMRRVAAPGGRVYAMENNILMCDFDPDCPGFESVWRKFAALQKLLGGDALVGKRLFRLFRSAGFEDVRLSIQPEIHHAGQPGFEPWLRNLIGNVRSGERALMERGLARREEIEAAVGELEALIQRADATALFYWNRAAGVK